MELANGLTKPSTSSEGAIAAALDVLQPHPVKIRVAATIVIMYCLIGILLVLRDVEKPPAFKGFA